MSRKSSENAGAFSKKVFGIGLGLRMPRKAGGAGGTKHKRRVWYEGPPLKWDASRNGWVSSIYQGKR